MEEVNLIAVLVAGVVSMGLGAFWYSPAGFGKIWMRHSGMTEEKINEVKGKGMAKSYVINFIAALVMAYVLGYVLSMLGALTLPGALGTACMLWIGFIAAVLIGTVLWEMKSWMYYAINAGYYLVSLLLMASVFTFFVG